MLVIKLEGMAIAKQSFRAVKGRAIGYKDKKVTAYESYVKSIAKTYMADEEPMIGPVLVSITAFFEIKKSYSKRKIDDIKSGRCFPTKKPDCDNIAKSILDSLNGIVFKDDSQVIDLIVKKRYSSRDHVTIIISELAKDDENGTSSQ